ncbi:MAG: DUF6266 family protein [Pedobacter sp.]|uniref:DUF6266 family protein n=1 Tax=Pedobacter sp. TaxID=1411316 RepID=UPI00339487D0
MAVIIQKGPIGTLKGKVGNVVVGKWRAKDVAKQKPAKMHKKKKKPQSDQNLRLGLVTHFLSPFSAYVKIGFEKKTNKNPGFQTAVEHNLKHVVIGEFPEYKIDYKKAVFSNGELDMAWGAKIALNGTDEIHVTWEVPETSKIRITGSDVVCLMLYSEEQSRLLYLGKKTYVRADLELTENFADIYHGNNLHGWLFFASPDGKSVSNTRYIGSVKVPEKEAAPAGDQPVLTA